MAEDNKKPFTFSDKIKSSKPASSPFSKRVSSKIGANGKPKQTLFERTRRDAPFFVAAAAALLLLPFLYKYSGTVEEAPIITPGADTVFDGERFDYDPVGDPASDVMQLAGRDSLSLIKGWGTPEEGEADYERYDIDDNYSHATPSVSSPEPYRQAAPAATRAAFRRATPTKINEMRGASMNLRGGGGIGSRFGGAQLRREARQPSVSGPARGTKPVALQPLRAAGSPTRSYFGQGGAAQARASRDAMSKSNAPAALRDAMFAPVENGKLAGLGTGTFGPGGAGGGKLDRNMNFKGITPWWWDMMKQQEMEKWKWRYFLFRKPLGDLIAKLMVEAGFNLGCCLLTGADDCAVDHFLGSAPSDGTPGTCKLYDKTETTYAQFCKDYISGEIKDGTYKVQCTSEKTFEKACKNGELGKTSTWKDGEGPSVGYGAFGQRLHCLGWNKKAKLDVDDAATEANECQYVNSHKLFELKVTGKPAKWKYRYHAVVVENDLNGKKICGPLPRRDCTSTISGVNQDKTKSTQSDGPIFERQKVDPDPNHKSTTRFSSGKTYENPELEAYDKDCVIYVGNSERFNYKMFQDEVGEVLENLGFQQGDVSKLKLRYIEGYAMKHPMSSTSISSLPLKKRMPMRYVDFLDVYVNHQGYSYCPNKAQIRKDVVMKGCDFNAFRITADKIPSPDQITGVLTFDPESHGQAGDKITVKVELKGDGFQAGPVAAVAVSDSEDNSSTTQKFILKDTNTLQQLMAYYKKNPTAKVTAHWTAEMEGTISTDDADYTGEGVEPRSELDDTPPQAETPEKVNVNATTFARTLATIPQLASGRKSLGSAAYLEPGAPESEAANSDKARKEAQKKALEAIKKNGNVLADGAPALFDTIVQNCFPNPGVDDNIALSSNQANTFMLKVREEYNSKHSDLPIAYDAMYPTIAQLVDAMNISISEGDQLVPKAAVCQLGKVVSNIFKDKTVYSSYTNKDGNPFNNTFGAFATYIEFDSIHFPSPEAEDAKDGVNRRFMPPLSVEHWYNFGDYCWNGECPPPNGQFRKDLDARKPYAENEDIFPLKDLSLLAGVTWAGGNAAADTKNRQTYWAKYRDIYPHGGCDKVYGDATMPAKDAINYIKMVCRVENAVKKEGMFYLSKPRASTRTSSTGNNDSVVSSGGGRESENVRD